jgi:hypothetical protein
VIRKPGITGWIGAFERCSHCSGSIRGQTKASRSNLTVQVVFSLNVDWFFSVEVFAMAASGHSAKNLSWDNLYRREKLLKLLTQVASLGAPLQPFPPGRYPGKVVTPAEGSFERRRDNLIYLPAADRGEKFF